MTGDLEKFLRDAESNGSAIKKALNIPTRTVAGIGPGGWDSQRLAYLQDHLNARDASFLYVPVGPINQLSMTVKSCIQCAIADPNSIYFPDAAYACARALYRLTKGQHTNG